MAEYFAVIPKTVSTQSVFDAINREVVGGMDGIIVVAHGNEKMGNYFSMDKDLVYKACIEQREILDKINSNRKIGWLSVLFPNFQIYVSRGFNKIIEDDISNPDVDYYNVSITLLNYPSKNDKNQINADYQSWLGPLELIPGNRSVGLLGASCDISKNMAFMYKVKCIDFPDWMTALIAKSARDVQMHGEVQETKGFCKFEIDLKRYCFRGSYSVYPEWINPSVSNYPLTFVNRFSSAVDSAGSDCRISVGRKYVSYNSADGRKTRTLGGNHFNIYNTKTRRSVWVGFEQYSDDDIPVRLFSSAVRIKLKELDIKI
jgi:hypothetical protein